MIVTPQSFVPGILPDAAAVGAPLAFVVHKARILILADSGTLAPAALAFTLFEAEAEKHYLGRLGQQPCWLLSLAEEKPLPPGLAWQGLRGLFGTASAEELNLLTRALQIAEWSLSHRYCGSCGEKTVAAPGERAKTCPACGFTAYPRLSPAIMVLVTRGRELLLARSTRFKVPLWSALAGFVEPGESLEDTLHREVREEVGISVRELSYFGSQSWPFPHSLMIAFTAAYDSGDLQPDGDEIAEAGWFPPEGLPPLPSSASIARFLIETTADRLR